MFVFQSPEVNQRGGGLFSDPIFFSLMGAMTLETRTKGLHSSSNEIIMFLRFGQQWPDIASDWLNSPTGYCYNNMIRILLQQYDMGIVIAI